jgi:hypothetical protein
MAPAAASESVTEPAGHVVQVVVLDVEIEPLQKRQNRLDVHYANVRLSHCAERVSVRTSRHQLFHRRRSYANLHHTINFLSGTLCT